jgi:hypothetical protein
LAARARATAASSVRRVSREGQAAGGGGGAKLGAACDAASRRGGPQLSDGAVAARETALARRRRAAPPRVLCGESWALQRRGTHRAADDDARLGSAMIFTDCRFRDRNAFQLILSERAKVAARRQVVRRAREPGRLAAAERRRKRPAPTTWMSCVYQMGAPARDVTGALASRAASRAVPRLPARGMQRRLHRRGPASGRAPRCCLHTHRFTGKAFSPLTLKKGGPARNPARCGDSTNAHATRLRRWFSGGGLAVCARSRPPL